MRINNANILPELNMCRICRLVKKILPGITRMLYYNLALFEMKGDWIAKPGAALV